MNGDLLFQLGPADPATLERFLTLRPVDNCIALGLLGRYGFDGPVSYYGFVPSGVAHASKQQQRPLAGVIVLDRGRALLLGDTGALPAAVAGLLETAHPRSVFAQTSVMEALLSGRSGLGPGPFVAWRHAPQEVEQQMVLQPVQPVPQTHMLPGTTIGEVAASEGLWVAAQLAAAATPVGRAGAIAGGVGRWSGETAATLTRRLRYGFIQAARSGGDSSALAGLVWANMSAPQYPRLSRLWVREDLRDEGIATALVAAACLTLKHQGALAVSAWVKQRDQAARRVLGKVGFGPGLLWKKVFLRS